MNRQLNIADNLPRFAYYLKHYEVNLIFYCRDIYLTCFVYYMAVTTENKVFFLTLMIVLLLYLVGKCLLTWRKFEKYLLPPGNTG